MRLSTNAGGTGSEDVGTQPAAIATHPCQLGLDIKMSLSMTRRLGCIAIRGSKAENETLLPPGEA